MLEQSVQGDGINVSLDIALSIKALPICFMVANRGSYFPSVEQVQLERVQYSTRKEIQYVGVGKEPKPTVDLIEEQTKEPSEESSENSPMAMLCCVHQPHFQADKATALISPLMDEDRNEETISVIVDSGTNVVGTPDEAILWNSKVTHRSISQGGTDEVGQSLELSEGMRRTGDVNDPSTTKSTTLHGHKNEPSTHEEVVGEVYRKKVLLLSVFHKQPKNQLVKMDGGSGSSVGGDEDNDDSGGDEGDGDDELEAIFRRLDDSLEIERDRTIVPERKLTREVDRFHQENKRVSQERPLDLSLDLSLPEAIFRRLDDSLEIERDRAIVPEKKLTREVDRFHQENKRVSQERPLVSLDLSLSDLSLDQENKRVSQERPLDLSLDLSLSDLSLDLSFDRVPRRAKAKVRGHKKERRPKKIKREPRSQPLNWGLTWILKEAKVMSSIELAHHLDEFYSHSFAHDSQSGEEMWARLCEETQALEEMSWSPIDVPMLLLRSKLLSWYLNRYDGLEHQKVVDLVVELETQDPDYSSHQLIAKIGGHKEILDNIIALCTTPHVAAPTVNKKSRSSKKESRSTLPFSGNSHDSWLQRWKELEKDSFLRVSEVLEVVLEDKGLGIVWKVTHLASSLVKESRLRGEEMFFRVMVEQKEVLEENGVGKDAMIGIGILNSLLEKDIHTRVGRTRSLSMLAVQKEVLRRKVVSEKEEGTHQAKEEESSVGTVVPTTVEREDDEKIGECLREEKFPGTLTDSHSLHNATLAREGAQSATTPLKIIVTTEQVIENQQLREKGQERGGGKQILDGMNVEEDKDVSDEGLEYSTIDNTIDSTLIVGGSFPKQVDTARGEERLFTPLFSLQFARLFNTFDPEGRGVSVDRGVEEEVIGEQCGGIQLDSNRNIVHQLETPDPQDLGEPSPDQRDGQDLGKQRRTEAGHSKVWGTLPPICPARGKSVKCRRLQEREHDPG
jgi:hypothetical protein